MERKIKIDDKAIVDLVVAKYGFVDEIEMITKKITELDETRMEKAKELQKIKDTLVPLVEKRLKDEMKEFEVFQSTTRPEDGTTEVVLLDFFEKFKEDFKNSMVHKKNDDKKRKKKVKK